MSDNSSITLDSLAKGLSLALTASIAGSICYDWGFLSSLDLEFRSVPSTIVDHTRSALLWFPSTVAIIFFAYILELMSRHAARDDIDDETAKRWRFWPGSLRRRGFAWLTTLNLVGIFILMGERALVPGIVGLALIWNAFSVWLLSRPKLQATFSSIEANLIIFIPLAAILLFGFGWSEGVSDRMREARAEITLTGQDSALPASILRTYEEGALLLVADHVEFVRWANVERMNLAEVEPPSPGILCRWFNVRCDG